MEVKHSCLKVPQIQPYKGDFDARAGRRRDIPLDECPTKFKIGQDAMDDDMDMTESDDDLEITKTVRRSLHANKPTNAKSKSTVLATEYVIC